MRTGDAEASSLMRWLSFYAANLQENCVSIVLRLLKLAFPATVEELKVLDGWKAIIATLEGFYEKNLVVDVRKLEGEINQTLTAILELVLGAVVQCETKEKFIKDILTMEDAVQADLMAIIEKVMVQGVSVLKVEAVDGKHEEKQEKDRPGIGSPLYLSRNAVVERVKRENVVLKEENIHLAQELEQAMEKLKEMGCEKEKMMEMMKGLKEQVDADALRKERVMQAEYNERINTLQLKLDSTRAELIEKQALASRVPALSDELDLLRPFAEKVKKMDSTVAKYKAKVDELSGAKDMLQRLESSNAELVEMNLALESNVAKAATWQRKIKEAKEAKTAMELRVIELETILAREREELRMTRFELDGIQGALLESKALNAQLQEAAAHQQATDAAECNNPALTIAAGIGEFNPELTQKLARLNYENAELKKQIDSETGARIDSLLDHIDDLSRLKKSFEEKYFDTQQTLQSTQSELKQTQEHVESIAAELQTRTREFHERRLCLQEDLSAQLVEKQTVVAVRDRLAADLSASVGREHQLELEISRRDRELSELQVVSEALTRQNEQLAEQYESLSRAQEDMKASLVRQVECGAMQFEDAHAERVRFQEQKAHELDRIRRYYEDQAADTTCRMTLLINAKSAEIEELTSRLQEDKLKYNADRKKLEDASVRITNELEQYQIQYSLSNADWETKEAELNSRIEELEQSRQQEQALKSTIRSQLESNTRLVEKNKAMKADAVDKRERIARLEHSTIRLESKVALLEKERSHFTTQDERKRSAVNGFSSYSSQLSTQVKLLTTELEKVLEENKDLHAKRVWCRCKNELLPTSDSGQKAKNYYLTRIQQVEHDKQQAEQKRRELLLVNAKLIQEQKQLYVKIASLNDRIHELEESVNHWRLCDERRRKNEMHEKLGALQSQHSSELPRNTSQSPSFVSSKNSTSCSRNSSPFRGRKRRLETTSDVGESIAASDSFTDAKEFFSNPALPSQSNPQPRPKRRLSHFISRTLDPNESKGEQNQPSECKQQ